MFGSAARRPLCKHVRVRGTEFRLDASPPTDKPAVRLGNRPRLTVTVRSSSSTASRILSCKSLSRAAVRKYSCASAWADVDCCPSGNALNHPSKRGSGLGVRGWKRNRDSQFGFRGLQKKSHTTIFLCESRAPNPEPRFLRVRGWQSPACRVSSFEFRFSRTWQTASVG